MLKFYDKGMHGEPEVGPLLSRLKSSHIKYVFLGQQFKFKAVTIVWSDGLIIVVKNICVLGILRV